MAKRQLSVLLMALFIDIFLINLLTVKYNLTPTTAIIVIDIIFALIIHRIYTGEWISIT